MGQNVPKVNSEECDFPGTITFIYNKKKRACNLSSTLCIMLYPKEIFSSPLALNLYLQQQVVLGLSLFNSAKLVQIGRIKMLTINFVPCSLHDSFFEVGQTT